MVVEKYTIIADEKYRAGPNGSGSGAVMGSIFKYRWKRAKDPSGAGS